jgi:hypothetical protein
MAPMDPELGRFHQLFQGWARQVRARLAARWLLSGLAIGFAAAGAVTLVLWWQRLGSLRPWSAALGVLGLLFGALVALRRRWSDGDVALYLDARLDAKEAISTAVELREQAQRADAAREVVVRQAASALGEGDRKRARPKMLDWLHGLVPLGSSAVVYLSIIPLPPAALPPAAPPGAETVQIANLAGLEKIEQLETLDARSAEQRERLKQIAEEAKKLRADLAKGMERREAQARIAKLRDDIAAERMKFGDQKNRAGLEAAVGRLSDHKNTKGAAKALGEGDLVEFDKQMAALANRAEKEDREEAKKALEEAAKAAREKGAKGLAEALEQQKKTFEKREAKAEALRELAKSLGGKLSEQAQKDLEEFGQSGSPESQKRLAEDLEKALEGLTPEERKRLAEKLQKQLEQNGGDASPMTKKQLEDLEKRLSSPEGQKELERQLKELAKPDSDKDADREKGLGDADKGGAEAEKGLGVMPVPMQGPGSPAGGKNQGGKGDAQKGNGGPGSEHDEGKGEHGGQSAKVNGKELRAKAHAKLNPGMPMQGSSLGRAPSRPGETANQAGTGALGRAAPSELGGVEGSEVPEEYREQVGRYFQP